MLGNHTAEVSARPKAARGAERAPVRARARYREPGLNPFDVELYDLSSTGFRMITCFRPQMGKRIWVNLPGLQPLEAIVRRSDGNNYGCEFLHPLHPAVAAHLQAKLREG